VHGTAVGHPHELEDPGQLLEVGQIRAQERVRRQDLVNVLDLPEERVESLPLLLIPEVFQDRLRPLVSCLVGSNRQELFPRRVELARALALSFCELAQQEGEREVRTASATPREG
jgi:hypothetical protein